MTRNSETEEIDLIELLQDLWDRKWLIGSTSAIALAIGSAYIALTPNNFDASIVVRPVDSAAIESFRLINDAIRDAQLTVGPTTPSLSSPGLLAQYIEVLLQRQTIIQAGSDNDDILENIYEDGMSHEAALQEFAFSVKIEPIEIPAPSLSGTKNFNTATAWRLTWHSSDEDISDAFIADALSLTNETARERLLMRINGEAQQIQRANTRRAVQLQQEIANILQDYHVQVNDSLARLSEQAALARIMERELAHGSTDFESNSRSSTVNISSGMTYLDGYRALEEQISILSSREEFEAFVPGLRDLQSELRSVEQDTRADELLAAVETTPLVNSARFRAVQYDLASIETIPHKKSSLILALSLIVGGFIGSVTVLMRNAINARRIMQKPNIQQL